ncbi:hypothetical protein BESB_076970 [Besnoitia besnoiti]|uniref:Uncharacterized protein n=1 Tax=Besnoitia besnoiti TaxID=94643 RepID=A0A2A9MDM1_BESBE|nr:hypothetical protein BESB_076970 [Besnoitia besnoiti]PFH33480.1 hypothetical protein BESB_076970 [Besnoitia besnoiti]
MCAALVSFIPRSTSRGSERVAAVLSSTVQASAAQRRQHFGAVPQLQEQELRTVSRLRFTGALGEQPKDRQAGGSGSRDFLQGPEPGYTSRRLSGVGADQRPRAKAHCWFAVWDQRGLLETEKPRGPKD